MVLLYGVGMMLWGECVGGQRAKEERSAASVERDAMRCYALRWTIRSSSLTHSLAHPLYAGGVGCTG